MHITTAWAQFLLKRKVLIYNSLLNRNEQNTNQTWHMLHGRLAGNLVHVLLLRLASFRA